MRRLIITVVLLLAGSAAARAQDFGVMETAETISAGTLTFKANPMLIFGEGEAENTFGISVLAGYGLLDNVDVKFGAAIYEGVSFVGGGAKLWLLTGPPIDFAVSAGFHLGRGDIVDTTGFDLTFIGSVPLSPQLNFYGALDLAFDSADDLDHTFKTAHLVPGLEYRVREGLDVLLEIGVALNGDSAHYLSGGITYYFR